MGSLAALAASGYEAKRAMTMSASWYIQPILRGSDAAAEGTSGCGATAISLPAARSGDPTDQFRLGGVIGTTIGVEQLVEPTL